MFTFDCGVSHCHMECGEEDQILYIWTWEAPRWHEYWWSEKSWEELRRAEKSREELKSWEEVRRASVKSWEKSRRVEKSWEEVRRGDVEPDWSNCWRRQMGCSVNNFWIFRENKENSCCFSLLPCIPTYSTPIHIVAPCCNSKTGEVCFAAKARGVRVALALCNLTRAIALDKSTQICINREIEKELNKKDNYVYIYI